MSTTTHAPASAWQQALSLLRRPVAPAAPPEQPKGAGRRFASTPSWEQAQREAEAAYRALLAERDAARHSIATHGDRREALLMEPGSDDAIVRLGIEVDRANAIIARCDVVLPELLGRLGDIKTQAREVRWCALRDTMAAKFSEFAEAEALYEATRAEWQAAADACVEAFYGEVYTEHQHNAPDIREILPHMAPLRPYTETFAQQLERFRTLTLVPKTPPRPQLASLQHHIDFARMTGAVHADCPPDWRAEVERAMRPTVKIELLSQWIDREGATHARGAIIEVPYEIGQARVSAGRAIYR